MVICEQTVENMSSRVKKIPWQQQHIGQEEGKWI